MIYGFKGGKNNPSTNGIQVERLNQTFVDQLGQKKREYKI